MNDALLKVLRFVRDHADGHCNIELHSRRASSPTRGGEAWPERRFGNASNARTVALAGRRAGAKRSYVCVELAVVRPTWLGLCCRFSGTLHGIGNRGGSVLWRIYTKTVEVEDGAVATRWFWRSPVMEGRKESLQAFTSRKACVADATKYGYTPDRESTPAFGE